MLGVDENGEGAVQVQFVDQCLLTAEAVRIAVIVQFGEAFAGEEGGVFADVGDDGFGSPLEKVERDGSTTKANLLLADAWK